MVSASPSKVSTASYTLVLHLYLHAPIATKKCNHCSFLFLKSKQEDQSSGKWTEGDPARRAKWWYSTFHTVTAMIGAGVLSLPYAMAYLGWYVSQYCNTAQKFVFNMYLQ
jgi:hypothetical protein